MRNMNTSQEVLNRIRFIQKNIKETNAYKVEICTVSVEENYDGALDPYEWAEQIRIKAYGLKCYSKRQFNSPTYQGFINFIADNTKQVEGVKNV